MTSLGSSLFVWSTAKSRCGVVALILVSLPCLFSVRTRKQSPGYEVLAAIEGSLIRKVFTTDGNECKFPFRLGGTIQHQCINITSTRKWCSLTHNFDRDLKWGYCAPPTALSTGSHPSLRRQLDVCQQRPCENGGVCVSAPHLASFHCICAEGFTGTRCQHRSCYELARLRHYEDGDSWGRVHLRTVERCTCTMGRTTCGRTRYTACSSNPCANDGACRMIEDTGEEVCACRPGYSGAFCSTIPEQRCYEDSGTMYRGTVNTTLSGSRCLPWNSELLFNELSMDTVENALLKGLGEHNFCRNPDEDALPWCYTLNDGALSWEYCDVPLCVRLSSRRVSPVGPWTSPSRKPNVGRVCGVRHQKRVSRGRIIGGSSALPGAHPWMAGLYIGDEFCAGSLVSSCWLITAAHCFIRNPLISSVRVVLGQHFFNDTGPNTRHFGIEKYIFHHHYSQFDPTLHDIVLVKLKRKDGRCAPRNQFIQTICLPDRDTSFPDHSCCTITGWGRTHENGNAYSHLREGVVRLIPFEKCSAPDVYGHEVRPSMVCAASQICVDACQGDSGGPLACLKNGKSVLYGVISWGDGCGRSEKPGVYTRVPSYATWVNSIIRKPKKFIQRRITKLVKPTQRSTL